MASNENLQNSTSSSNDADHHQDSMNHGGTSPKNQIAEEVKGVLEVIASKGKFWHDWEKLKSILSFQLKQVLSEYPEAKMSSEHQTASFGEPFMELVKRLDEALDSFYEGPPFTLQRLCEILLDARGIYPNLSKLALALEKNLLVTSMLTMSTDPYPTLTIEKRKESHEANEEPKSRAGSVQNGGEANKADDRDEVMTEVEGADINDNMTLDMEGCEDIVGSSENNKVPTSNS